jgi:steroid delta-isomerase-like uncharacterized protein
VSAEENMALVRRWFAAIDAHDLAAIDELLAEDYVDHNPGLPDQPPGREGVLRTCLAMIEAFPDSVHTIEEQTAHDDRVMTRVTTRGTFTKGILGFSPTGTAVEVVGVAVHRVAGGKLVEHWAHVDMAGFMDQIGAGGGKDTADVGVALPR